MSRRSRTSAVHQDARAGSPAPGRELSPLRTSVFLAIAAFTVLLAWRTESSRDFGYHLATGRWILEHGSWPRVDSFTWTLSGRPYLDLHGLFQIVLALAHRAGGMIGVGVLRVLFAAATVAL